MPHGLQGAFHGGRGSGADFGIVRMKKKNPPFTVEAHNRTISKAFPTFHLETVVSMNQGTGEPGGSLKVSLL
jgi:hypothetical protein